MRKYAPFHNEGDHDGRFELSRDGSLWSRKLPSICHMTYFALTEGARDASVTVVTPTEYTALLQANLVRAAIDIVVHEGDMTRDPYRITQGTNGVELTRQESGLALRFVRDGREVFAEEIALGDGPDDAIVFQVLEHLSDGAALTHY